MVSKKKKMKKKKYLRASELVSEDVILIILGEQFSDAL
jgi:hypothetical protein